MSLRTGDKIRIRKDLKAGHYPSNFAGISGEVLEIADPTSKLDKYTVKIKLDPEQNFHSPIWFSIDELEPLCENPSQQRYRCYL